MGVAHSILFAIIDMKSIWFPTRCFHCGRKRLSGYFMERAGFKVPICSAFLQRCDIKHIKDWKVRWANQIWTIKKEELK